MTLHPSQIKSVKRPMDIVRSAPAVLRRQPNALYLIVGEGPRLADMQALAEQRGVRTFAAIALTCSQPRGQADARRCPLRDLRRDVVEVSRVDGAAG